MNRRYNIIKNKKSWEEVKRVVKLDDTFIAKAKALGLTPRTVLANYRSTTQEKWKTSTKQWIEELYAQKTKKSI